MTSVVPRRQVAADAVTPTSARVRPVLAAASLLAVAVLGGYVRVRLPGLDGWLHAVAVRHRGGTVQLARVVTQGGSTLVIWPMVVVAALRFPRSSGRRRWLDALVFGAAVGAGIGVRLLTSDVVRRTRPPVADWATSAGGFAFPSGHTAAATIGIGALAWAVGRHWAGRTPARAIVWTAAAVYAGVVGWSRVWLGVHWPTDVIGGWLLGIGWLLAVSLLFEVRPLTGGPHPPGVDPPDVDPPDVDPQGGGTTSS